MQVKNPKYSRAQFSTVQNSAEQYKSMQYDTKQYNANNEIEYTKHNPLLSTGRS